VSRRPYIRRLLVLPLILAVVAGTAAQAVAGPPTRIVRGVDIAGPDAETTAWKVNNRGQVLFFAGATIWQDGRYVELGSLGGTYTGGWDLNDAGEVVGDSELADGAVHAFRWSRGRITDLGTLGGSSSIATSIGANGDITGRSALPDGSEHVFHWRRGVLTDTGIPSRFGSQIFVNARGQIAATYLSDDLSAERAFFWDRGRVTEIPAFGGTQVNVLDINDRGEVVGQARNAAGEFHAFRWWRGRMTDLGTLGGSDSGASDINNRGQIAGTSGTGHGDRAFRWENGVMTGLGDQSTGAAINEHGDVVGIQLTENGYRGTVWRRDRMLTLDALGRETSGASDINDAGLAVGFTSPGPFEPTRATVWRTGQR
jgi:probable HAF family extracellular repeat protein